MQNESQVRKKAGVLNKNLSSRNGSTSTKAMEPNGRETVQNSLKKGRRSLPRSPESKANKRPTMDRKRTAFQNKRKREFDNDPEFGTQRHMKKKQRTTKDSALFAGKVAESKRYKSLSLSEKPKAIHDEEILLPPRILSSSRRKAITKGNRNSPANTIPHRSVSKYPSLSEYENGARIHNILKSSNGEADDNNYEESASLMGSHSRKETHSRTQMYDAEELEEVEDAIEETEEQDDEGENEENEKEIVDEFMEQGNEEGELEAEHENSEEETGAVRISRYEQQQQRESEETEGSNLPTSMDNEYLVGPGENDEDELNLSDIEVLEANNDPLARLLRQQEEEKMVRMMESGELQRSKKLSKPGARKKHLPGLGVEMAWQAEVSRRDREFYYGKEALLQVPRVVVKKRTGKRMTTPFRSIGVNEENNRDIRYIGEVSFGNIARHGSSHESWEQFRICSGQFLRACVAYHRVELNEAWKPGQFLKVASDKFIFRAFLQHFAGKGSAASLMNKAKLLARFVKSAIMYFSKKPRYSNDSENRKMQAQMEEVLVYLNQMGTENAKLAKVRRAREKEEVPRIESMKFIPEQDFDTFREIALKNLHGIMDTVHRETERIGKYDLSTKTSAFRSLTVVRKGLLSKWTLNFTSLLILFGNGQRNQVYRMLKAPNAADLRVHGRGTKPNQPKPILKLGLVESSVEKVCRDAMIPYIMFDSAILPSLLFHVEVARPLLLEKAEECGLKKSDYLVLHSKFGTPLTSCNIRYAILQFVRNIDPELHITPMDLRASFATYMIRKYIQAQSKKDGNIIGSFQCLSTLQFKSMMAAVMNTSVAMLEKVYMEASHASYGDQIADILKLGDFSERNEE